MSPFVRLLRCLQLELCWVVQGLLHRLNPDHWCCFPLWAGLFVRQKYCPEHFEDKLQIASRLMNSLKLPENTLLVGDNFYGAARLSNELSEDILSHLKHTAVAYQYPEPSCNQGRGRPQIYGDKVQLITYLDNSQSLKTHTLVIYGQEKTVKMASFEGSEGQTLYIKVYTLKEVCLSG